MALTCFLLVVLVVVFDVELALEGVLPFAEVGVLAGSEAWMEFWRQNMFTHTKAAFIWEYINKSIHKI